MIATTAASQRPWNGGSFSSRSTGPKPCIPPRSWTPSIAPPADRILRLFFSIGSPSWHGACVHMVEEPNIRARAPRAPEESYEQAHGGIRGDGGLRRRPGSDGVREEPHAEGRGEGRRGDRAGQAD